MKKESTGTQEITDREGERFGETKDVTERKLRYKLLTDRSLTKTTSSHFINSLLILTPFAADREKLLQETRLGELIDGEDGGAVTSHPRLRQIDGDTSTLKALPTALFAIIGLFSICLGFAWKAYEPPCMYDYILEFIPFFHRRRTFVQIFFDEILQLMSNMFGG